MSYIIDDMYTWGYNKTTYYYVKCIIEQLIYEQFFESKYFSWGSQVSICQFSISYSQHFNLNSTCSRQYFLSELSYVQEMFIQILIRYNTCTDEKHRSDTSVYILYVHTCNVQTILRLTTVGTDIFRFSFSIFLNKKLC